MRPVPCRAVDLPARLRDRLPLVSLAAGLLLPLVALLLAGDWFQDAIMGPWRTQADPVPGLRSGYSAASLGFWALEGLLLGYPAFHLVFARWRIAPDARFFAALAPLLLFGPLYHALLSAGEIARGSVWAYAAAEPPVYLTTALLALVGLAAGRALKRPHDGLLFVGLVAVAAALVRAVDAASYADLGRAAGLLLLALTAAALLTPIGRRIAPEAAAAAVFAVVGAHALDGATTWLSLRDPFGWGFEGFRESNPFALRLVEMANGWPYFAVKLALPLVLLGALRKSGREHPAQDAHELETEARLRTLLLFVVFVLGFGPGMSNLMKVVLG
jgi:uncharacterized membrane protein